MTHLLAHYGLSGCVREIGVEPGVAAGFVMFSLVAFAGFYVTLPALITGMIGTDVRKDFILSFVDKTYQFRYPYNCPFWIYLRGAPTFFNQFCATTNDVDPRWGEGSRVFLYGRESTLGFRFTRIESQ